MLIFNSDTSTQLDSLYHTRQLHSEQKLIGFKVYKTSSTRNLRHLEENPGSLDIALTSDDSSKLANEFSKLIAHGGRMHKAHFAQVEPA